MLYAQISQNLNGIKIGTIEDAGNDIDILLKSSQFNGDVDVNNILSLPLVVGPTTYRVGDFVESRISGATANISRQDGKIQITIDADAEDVKQGVALQSQFLEFAKTYQYPSGVSYQA